MTSINTTGTNASPLNNLPSIAAAAMRGSLNISVWEGRKRDTATQAEVQASKGARSKRAATVNKHLFAESPALEAIKNLRSEARMWFNKVTLPWDDNGSRIITTAQYMDVMAEIDRYQQRFAHLVSVFVNTYSTEISKQAFELGALFNRNDYPRADEIARKFGFMLSVEPLPVAGDFRVDVGNAALQELQQRYEEIANARVQQAMGDAWDRIKRQVEWVHERMSAVLAHDPDARDEETGKAVSKPRLHESMLTNGLELCALLRDLNLTQDPALEAVRQELESSLVNVDIDSLRESPAVQSTVKTSMESILSKFNF